MKIRIRHTLCVLLSLICLQANSQDTYAEKLGFPKGAKVLILHVDDVGMSWDSNQGAVQALEQGVATSVSIMMPCSWVPGFMHYLNQNPNVDAGLHLTFTSEWKDYRWGPLSGKTSVPGLVDQQGALWSSVEEVVANATADEIEKEIRSQIDRSTTMGWKPTHMDSHMGTLFAKPEFLMRFIKVGLEMKIPVMLPGGHNTMLASSNDLSAESLAGVRQLGTMVWNGGLPVLDDLHNLSYSWHEGQPKKNDDELRKFTTGKYISTIKDLKPGLTMVIMHCTSPSAIFGFISDSGQIRRGDLLAMTDPVFKKFLQDEKIILTTWREVMKRRQSIK